MVADAVGFADEGDTAALEAEAMAAAEVDSLVALPPGAVAAVMGVVGDVAMTVPCVEGELEGIGSNGEADESTGIDADLFLSGLTGLLCVCTS